MSSLKRFQEVDQLLEQPFELASAHAAVLEPSVQVSEFDLVRTYASDSGTGGGQGVVVAELVCRVPPLAQVLTDSGSRVAEGDYKPSSCTHLSRAARHPQP